MDRVADYAFALGFVGIAWLAVFGHRGMAPAVGVMALASAMRADLWRDGWRRIRPAHLFSDPLSLSFAAIFFFSAWTATTAFWTPVPGAEWLGLTVLFAALSAGALAYEALNTPHARARRLANWFLAAVTAACAALMFEGLSGAYLREVVPPQDVSPQRWKDFISLGRGVTAMAPLVFPLAVILRRISGSWFVAFAPALALMFAAQEFSIFANVAALFCGAAFFAAAMVRPRLCLQLTAGLFIAALIAAPVLGSAISVDMVASGALGDMPASWAQRLLIWSKASELALGECLPFGCGADYARAVSENAAEILIPNWPFPVSVMATHPHNVFLQIWLELGVPGVAAFGLAAAAGFAALLKASLQREIAAAICAVFVAAFISLMFEASIWQVWRLAVFALAAFSCALASRR